MTKNSQVLTGAIVVLIACFSLSLNAQTKYSLLSTYNDDSSLLKQWYIDASSDTIFSVGRFGVRAFDFSDKKTLQLIGQNETPADHKKRVRSVSPLNDVIYVATRQATAGDKESFVPDYRFRFEDQVDDFKIGTGEFDNYVNEGGITVDEFGEPNYNVGKHGIRFFSSSDLNNFSSAILEKKGNVSNQKYSSLWIKVNQIGLNEISIPLRRNNDETILSLIISPLSESSFSLHLSNNLYASYFEQFDVNEWLCLKVYADEGKTYLWWRTKECGDWKLLQEGSGISEFNSVSLGIYTNEPNISLVFDDYYCHSSEIDEVSYVNGTVEVLDRKDLHTIKRYNSDLKFIQAKTIDNLLVVSGINGFNIYDISDNYNPVLISAHREPTYLEFQGFDFYKNEDKTYVVFSNCTQGISIWDISDPYSPGCVIYYPHKGLVIDGYKLSQRMYTFDLIADYPYVYSTFAVKESISASDNDCRGVICYDISNTENITPVIYPVDRNDWYTQPTDDLEPTVIRKYENRLLINMSERGLSCYIIREKGDLQYEGLIPIQNGSVISAFDISSDGYLFVGTFKGGTLYCLKEQDPSDGVKSVYNDMNKKHELYGVSGIKVGTNYRGLVIDSGKKIIKQ